MKIISEWPKTESQISYKQFIPICTKLHNNDIASLKCWKQHLVDVGVVKGSIHFIKHKERGWLVAAQWSYHHFLQAYKFTNSSIIFYPHNPPMNSKQQSEGSDSFFSSRQVIHGSKSFSRCHTIVWNAVQVGFLSILWAQKCLCTLVLRQGLVVGINADEMKKFFITKASLEL